jgi:hypothetical protein
MGRKPKFNRVKFLVTGDREMSNVMPNDWEGHARLKVYEMAEDFSDDEHLFARELVSRVHPKAPTSHEAVAKAVIKATVKNLR